MGAAQADIPFQCQGWNQADIPPKKTLDRLCLLHSIEQCANVHPRFVYPEANVGNGSDADIDLKRLRPQIATMIRRGLRYTKFVLAALFLALFAAMLVLKFLPKPEPKPVQAIVTYIAADPDGLHAMVRVTARTREGYFGSRSIGLQNLSCRVGDTIDGELRGTSLSINEQSCRRSR